MKRLYFLYYRWRYDIPCPAEIFALASRSNQRVKTRGSWMILSYAYGHSVEAIATGHNVNRERVRQVIWKFWRQERKK